MNPEFTPRWRGECRIHRAAAALIAAAAVLLAGCSGTPTNASAGHTAPATHAGFRALDLSFVGDADGWALGTAPCPSRPRHRCAAMRRTTDGGQRWTPMKAPPITVGVAGNCSLPCAEHLRFATRDIGYAFGPGAFLMTTDGGRHWTRQRGGAEAVESLDGNVIRVRPVVNGCELGCAYVIETSALGSAVWTRRAQAVASWSIDLVRSGPYAYVLASPHFSGNSPSTLYRSADDGSTWQITHRPCRSVGGYRALALSAGPSEQLTVLCTAAGKSTGFVAVSPDGGANLRARVGTPIPNALAGAANLVGDPADVLIAALALDRARHTVYRSADGGWSWAPVTAISGGVSWLGFESKTDGRIIGDNGRTIWTTHDAGAHWTPFTFG